MANILSLVNKSGNPRHESATNVLDTCRKRMTAGEYGVAPRCMVLVDSSGVGAASLQFDYESSGFSALEAVGLLEAAKHKILAERFEAPKLDKEA
jgi:hypothetical protein